MEGEKPIKHSAFVMPVRVKIAWKKKISCLSLSLLLGQEGEISHVGSYALSAYVSAYIIIPGFSKISQLLIFMLCHTPGFLAEKESRQLNRCFEQRYFIV